MGWNDGASGGGAITALATLSEEQRRALAMELLGQCKGKDAAEQLVNLLCNAPENCRENLKRLVGCGGSCGTDGGAVTALLAKLREQNCYNRRLSVLEEDRLRANVGGAIDIPTVAGAGGVQKVTVPAYNVEYYLTQFSMDGQISTNTGALSKVQVLVEHAGFVIADFRVSQFFKENCCTTVVEAFKRRRLCFGWASSFTITVTNNNANANEEFINGVFSYIRGYPDPIAGICS